MSETCNHISCVHKVPIFENLSISEIDAISDILEHKHYDKGDVIYSPGEINDKLYIVNQGKVKISRISEDGKEQVMSILNTGEFTNELALFNKVETKEFAYALTHTEICMISSEALKEHMLRYPSTAIKIIETLSQRLGTSMNLIEGVTIRSAMWRLAKEIKDKAIDNVYTIETTKAMFASTLGMTQETLSRKLAELQDLNVVRFITNKEIHILSKAKLMEIIDA